MSWATVEDLSFTPWLLGSAPHHPAQSALGANDEREPICAQRIWDRCAGSSCHEADLSGRGDSVEEERNKTKGEREAHDREIMGTEMWN